MDVLILWMKTNSLLYESSHFAAGKHHPLALSKLEKITVGLKNFRNHHGCKHSMCHAQGTCS